MTFEPPYWEDPKKTEFESEVEKVKDEKVVLKCTYFHPEEGGQPADKGTLGGYPVKDVQKEGDEIVHFLDPSHDLHEGQSVEGKIDEEFRSFCMRSHTGAHVVFGAGREVLGEVDYSGFDIGEKKARIDFETSTHIDRKKLLKMEELCNEVILENRPVKWRKVNREEIENDREIAFAKEIPEGEKVRIIEIEDWDLGVCSGTHLTNSLEVGRIRILGKKKLQEGVTRINFSIGEEALKRDYREKRSLYRATSLLETDHKNLPRKIDDLLSNLKELEEEMERLEALRIERKVDEAESYDRDGYQLLVQTLEASSEHSELISHRAKDSVGEKEVLVLINKDENVSVTVGAGKNAEGLDADEVIKELSQEFGGGGGGTAEFAQGGGFDASVEEIKRYVMEAF